MKAAVPYLARLARQAAGDPVLRPPRQLFSGDARIAVRSPGHQGFYQPHADLAATPEPFVFLPLPSGEEQPPAPSTAGFPPARDTLGEPAAGPSAEAALPGGPAAALPPAPPAEAVPTGPAPLTPAATASAAPPRPPQLQPHHRGAAAPGFPAADDSDRAYPPGGRPVSPLAEPRPVSSPRHTANTVDAAPGRPPHSWTSALWDGPVDLPEASRPALASGEPEPWGVPSSPAGPVAPPSPPWPAPAAGWHQGQPSDDAGTQLADATSDALIMPGVADDADPGRAPEPSAVRDLLPPLTAAQVPAASLGAEPGERRREPRVPPPRVSIGTIEVTVVPPPPAPVAPAVGTSGPAAQAMPSWSGPVAPPTTAAGPDRLRDGVRRWFGTAQG
jgi:hypothetical protein